MDLSQIVIDPEMTDRIRAKFDSAQTTPHILSPIGVVITAVAALAGCLLYSTGAGAKALGWLLDAMNASASLMAGGK